MKIKNVIKKAITKQNEWLTNIAVWIILKLRLRNTKQNQREVCTILGLSAGFVIAIAIRYGFMR